MNIVQRNIKWLMLVSGCVTATMLFAVIKPQVVLQQTFGASLHGPLAEVLVRNWGLLVGLIGFMLIYGAFNPIHRSLILTIATLSKLGFLLLVVSLGQAFLSTAAPALCFDAVIVICFSFYLWRQPETDNLTRD